MDRAVPVGYRAIYLSSAIPVYGFVHGPLHIGNFFLKKQYKVRDCSHPELLLLLVLLVVSLLEDLVDLRPPARLV